MSGAILHKLTENSWDFDLFYLVKYIYKYIYFIYIYKIGINFHQMVVKNMKKWESFLSKIDQSLE